MSNIGSLCVVYSMSKLEVEFQQVVFQSLVNANFLGVLLQTNAHKSYVPPLILWFLVLI